MRFLVAVLVTFAVAVSPGADASRPPLAKKPRLPAAEMQALNTHESFVLRPNSAGRFTRNELRGWNRFLRCHHTGRSHPMATRLASLIYDTAKHFNFAKVLVVAGYRAPRVAREKGNPKSPHKKGLACDFRLEGVANSDLRDYVRGAFARVGVGYYPNSDFVHLDVRDKTSAFWIDYSGPGERARYSRSPDEDVRAEQTLPEVEEIDQAPLANKVEEKTEGSQPQTGLGPGATTPNSQALVPVTP